MLLNLRELQAFKAIAELGSLGRAAEALSLTQPALTRTLKRLERQLGVPLFERHPHGMALTSYGQALVPHAGLLLSGSDEALRAVNELLGLSRGTVRIGAVSSAVEHLLPPAIERLLAAHPPLQVQIVEGLSDELLLALARGEVDLALGFSAAEDEDVVLVSESGWQEGCHVVCGAGHPLLARSLVGLADLAGERWVLPPRRMGPREEWQQLFWDHGLPAPAVAVEARSINAIRALVATRGFLSWMPPVAARRRAADASAHRGAARARGAGGAQLCAVPASPWTAAAGGRCPARRAAEAGGGPAILGGAAAPPAGGSGLTPHTDPLWHRTPMSWGPRHDAP